MPDLNNEETPRIEETVIIEHEPPQPGLLSTILAIITFIVVAVVVIWGLIHLVSLTQNWLASRSGNSSVNTSLITVTAPTTATSSAPIIVSWNYTPNTAGSYALLYQCEGGVGFATPSPSGTSTIPCGTQVLLAGTNNEMNLTPRLAGTSTIADTLTIFFVPSATSSPQAQGSATILISPTPTVAKQSKPATTPHYTASSGKSTTTYTRTRTPADLSVRIISANVDAWGNGTVVFNIANIGGSPTGTYSFTAQLPMSYPYVYASPLQRSLGSGAHVVSTLRFSNATAGTIVITADPNSTTYNGTRNNNTASVWIGNSYVVPEP